MAISLDGPLDASEVRQEILMHLTILPGITSPVDLKALDLDQLPKLAEEMRHAICTQVQQTGGHLAPNLGVVELFIALHRVFDFGHDRLLFDVGHQCYPHKLLTGRYPMLSKLRQKDGMGGFPDPSESDYDLFMVGHAGTAISTATGMARGDTLRGEGWSPENPGGRRTVAFVGDASIVNGLSMEGLNHAGTLDRQFLVVLNDNGMSISRPQGALASYFDRLRVSDTYRSMKKAAKGMVDGIPGGDAIRSIGHRLGEVAKDVVNEDPWFEKFGLLHVGPIDGHDIPSLIEALATVKDVNLPLVLHAHTIKGKGYEYTEGDATAFHAAKPHRVTGCRVEVKSGGHSFTSAFGDALCDLMQRDDSVTACSAAMADGTGVQKAIDRFPERTWDTGICESHAADMMAGMAKTGLRPFFAVYATFMQRAFDQCFQESSLQGLPLRLCLDRAGLVGGDGAVHHGFCDVSILRTLPGAVLMAAIDEPSLREALEFMRTWDDGLTAVRYPRDDVNEMLSGTQCPPYFLGKAVCLRSEPAADVVVLAYGVPALTAIEAADRLGGELAVEVWDARFAKPVDGDLIERILRSGTPILTIEEHSLIGGFGSAVIDEAVARGFDASLIERSGLPDRWIHQGSRGEQLAEAGLDLDGITTSMRAAAGRVKSPPPPMVEVPKRTSAVQ
ncbi:MAG: 1-deoxy-D-xylulose-5-phosphate synthase [Phycisphaerales bacterium]|jgi:1-deoxy-D-xylulose-5-phosphate synthase|nr:1-deoxy-D-xylulose-5-phosphate synthase [Phycisphaerales bacterium]MDP6890915.1 1-deoxy-D-xylulose-5-phosphate synthase [Phycisphaerales bacterium]